MSKYVIIGNGVAAAGCIEGIRSVDKDSEVTVISAEKHPVYARPLISYYLEGKTTLEKMNYRSEDFYEKNKAQIHGVHVDCHDLDYISSAGLRVLLIMQKGCENGVMIAEINDVISEILEQTGFDQILTVV